MTTPNIQFWFAADITFKHLTTAASITYRFSSRMPVGETTVIYYPLLRSIRKCGLTVGQDGMPVKSSGTVEIDDPFGAIGEEKRVFDLLQEYTPINQTITIYDAQTALTDTAPYADMTARWKGVVKNVSKGFSEEGQTLVFSVESMSLPVDTFGVDINETNLLDSSNPSPQESARGKTVPAIFAQEPVPVSGIRYRMDSIASYAIAASPYGLSPTDIYKPSEDLEHLYIKDSDGTYKYTYFYLGNGGYPAADSGTEGGTYPEPRTGTVEYIYDLENCWNATEEAFLISGGKWRFKGLGAFAGTPSGNITFSLYALGRYSPGLWYTPIDPPIATVDVPKADYNTSVKGASDFWVYFQFPEPIRIPRRNLPSGVVRYAISCKQSAFATIATDYIDGGHTGAQPSMIYGNRPSALGQDSWDWPGATASYPVFVLFGVSAAFGTASLGAYWTGRTIHLYQAPDSARSSFLTQMNIDMAFKTMGMSDGLSRLNPSSDAWYGDDTSGTIITKPNDVATALTATYSGTTLQRSADWDFSCFSTLQQTVFSTSSPYYRRVNGFLEGRVTKTDYLKKLCAETACCIVQRTNGKFALWPWGATSTVTKVYTDEDILSLNSWERLDPSSIVNKSSIYGAKGYLNINQTQNAAQRNEFANYSISQCRDSSTSAYDSFLTATSQSIYGDSELDRVTTDLLADSQSIKALGDYYFRTHDHPHTVTSFDVDYVESASVELMDIVELLSAMLPASGGSSMNGREATYTSEQVVTAHAGKYITRAQRYRAQLVGREINFERGSIPTLTLEARIVSPYHPNDPT